MRRLMLLLCLATLAIPASAAAATPAFGVWDIQTDLSSASRNVYGDVKVRPEQALAGKGTAVRCAAWCRFGAGWLAFSKRPHLSAADVASAAFGYSKHKGWFVRLTLRPAAVARWRAFVRTVTSGSKQRGVPDVLVVAVGGQIAASPFATQVTSAGGVVTIAGFSRASAKALQSGLNG
ncbi:MAG: hypothetical protein ABUS54_03170 [Actinomycetota bacterium]